MGSGATQQGAEVESQGAETELLMAPPGGSIPGASMETLGGHTQLERRKSVKDLVTDFSSCISSVSSGEETLGDFGEQVTRRKKKKRKASTSPILDSNVSKGNTNST